MKLTRIVLLISILFIPVFNFSAPFLLVKGQVNISQKHASNPNRHVKLGLLLSKHPLNHFPSPQDLEDKAAELSKSLSYEERLRMAIGEFNLALKDKEITGDYASSQIYSFIGRAYRLLGAELQRKVEKSADKNADLKVESQKAFGDAVNSYFQAIKENKNKEGDDYIVAKELIKTIISSGDLNKALATIDELEGKIKINKDRDAILIRMKADIYFIMDREEDAALAYEEWIKRGNTGSYYESDSSYKQKLKYLKERTGHPINFSF